MLLETLNPAQIVLQVQAQNPDGTPKIELATATVRVYHIVSGAEVTVYGPRPLLHVPNTNIWRVVWTPGTLAEDTYFAEYTLVDLAGAKFVAAEEIIVRDIARQTDVAFIRQIEQGRWKIANNKMYFYDNDNVTPLLVFDLKDLNGLPSMINVFERVPT